MAPTGRGGRGEDAPRSTRVVAAARLLLFGGVLVTSVGVAGRFLQWPILTATLGPTLYVFLAHPNSGSSRLRAAVIGHAVAVAMGLAALAVFGLWAHPASAVAGHVSLRQAGAAGVALGGTLAVLQLARAHHAPAAATTLLIASGLARPGRPLFGLLLGLCIVIGLGPLLARAPLGRRAMADTEQAP